jgi:vacuolar-type H+-ATPase subunit E/Vma4
MPEGSADALQPVRQALLADARSRADATLAKAREQAEQRRAKARAEGAALLAEARAAGEESARAAAQTDIMRARRAARGLILTAQRELYDELTMQAQQAVVLLRQDPDYPDGLRRLAERARAELGTGAVIVEHPVGGVLGTCEGRSLDLSLPALAARALEQLGEEVTALWASSPG